MRKGIMDKLRQWRKPRIKVEPRENAELIEMMAVSEDNPVLKGCVTLLRGLQEEAGRVQADPKMSDREAAMWDGRYAAFEEAQDFLLEYAEHALSLRAAE